MKNAKETIVWTVDNQSANGVGAAYAGKNAKRKALSESGGKSRRMTESQFRKAYPGRSIVTLS